MKTIYAITILILIAIYVLMGISIYKVDTELQKERKKNEVLSNEHPRIVSGLELFIIPLRDSIGDLCWNKKYFNPEFPDNVIITSECPLDSNRVHTNVNYLKDSRR
jgi:hypothetical protein